MSKASIVSGMGVAMSLVTSLMKMILENGGDEEMIHRLATPEGEETLRKMARIAIEDATGQELERVPKVGEKAYTKYHGDRFEGVLIQMGARIDALIPVNGKTWGYHGNFPGLFVAYMDGIVWDEKSGMWYAPADAD